MNFDVDIEGLPKNQFFLDLLMDGTEVSGFMQVPNVPELANGYRAYAEQDLLEEVYRKFAPLNAALMRVAMEEEAMPEGVGPFFDELSSLYTNLPPELGQSMHPAGYWSNGLRYFTCRKFQVKDGVVEATLTADFQEGTGLRRLVDTMVEAMVSSERLREEDLEEAFAMVPLFNSLIDQARLVMRFDENTGIPIGLEFDFNFDLRDTHVDFESVIHVRLSYLGELIVPNGAEDIIFQPQPEAAENLDISGFIHIGISHLLNLAEEVEAEEDFDF